MVLINRGKTLCSICNQVITQQDDLVGVPAFCGNEADRLFVFNDAAFHKRCFEQHPDSHEIMRRVDEQFRRAGPGKHQCFICKETILTPDNYVHLHFLVEAAQHPLFQFNYAQFHKSCLANWSGTSRLIDLIEDLDRSGTWRGNMLKFLSNQLRSTLQT
jgi:hypothetical protein